MMVSVVFLRFSGKARSIVVWTKGGSSWCPLAGGEQRQPSVHLLVSASIPCQQSWLSWSRGVASHGTPSMGNCEPCFKRSLPTPAQGVCSHFWRGDKEGLKGVPSQRYPSLRRLSLNPIHPTRQSRSAYCP